MASVRKSGAGWLMIWNAGSGDGRKQAYRKFEGASKRAAIAEARRLEAEAKGLDAAGAKDTLGAYLDRWVAAHRAKVSTRTMDRYITLLAHVRPRLGSRPLRDVSGRDLQTLYAELAAGADSRPLAANKKQERAALVEEEA